MPWFVATFLLTIIAGVSLFAWWRETRSRPVPLQTAARVDIDLGSGVSIGPSIGPSAILSPDGTRLVFVSEGSDKVPRVLTRRLDESKPTLVPGTEGAYSPFFSPDGQWIGFFAGGKLKKTQLIGGTPVALC